MRTAKESFEQLTREFWPAYFRGHPDHATAFGFSGFDHLLPDLSDTGESHRRALTAHTLAALEEIRPDDLTPDQALDWRAMRGQLILAMDEQSRLDWRTRYPHALMPTDAIYELTVRPVTNRAKALQARVAAVPQQLAQAQEFLAKTPEAIPQLWVESTLQTAKASVDFLSALAQLPEGDTLPLAEAKKAMFHFATFLEQDLSPSAQGEIAAGRRRFELLLQHRHGLQCSIEALESFADRLIADTEKALREVTQNIQGNENIAALAEKIQRDFPQGDALLATYRQSVADAKAFVQSHELVSWPAKESLEVVATPLFLRHEIPLAAYLDPTPNDPEQLGRYYVTPFTDAALGAEHNFFTLMHTSVHEAYPGHHLQFSLANSKAESRSYARLVNASATLYEGWALYCEALMVEQGFLNKPEHRFILLKDRLWRALRIKIDIGLHVHGMSPETAAKLLSERAHFPQSQAEGEIRWYSQAPTVPMGYASGWALIQALRQNELGENPTNTQLKNFHDRLLGSGSLALTWCVEHAFGTTAANHMQNAVFR